MQSEECRVQSENSETAERPKIGAIAECLKRLGLATGRGSRANDAPERLLINGPSLVAPDATPGLFALGNAADA